MSQLIDLGKLRFSFQGEWSASTQYELNDVVKYGGSVYCYVNPLKTVGTLPTTTTHWQLLVSGLVFKGSYDAATAYKVGEVVAYGPNLHVALVDVTGVLPTDATKWSLLLSGMSFEGAYDGGVGYQRGDVVTYGANAYVAIKDAAGVLPTTTSSWTPLVSGIAPQGVYNPATAYKLGDLVGYGGRIYRALGDTVGNLPTVTTKWAVFVDGIRPRGDWATATAYQPNDVVVRGGTTYIALSAHASTDFTADAARWSRFNSGVRWRGTLTAGADYLVDDLVFSGVSTFIATANFTATSANPADHAGLTLMAKGADTLPSQTGNGGKFLTTNGTSVSWGSAGEAWRAISAATTAQAGEGLLVNTSNGGFTVTLPASPNVGDKVRFVDVAGTFPTKNLTVARGGSALIERLVEDLVLDVNTPVELVFSGATYGWKVL